MSRRVLEGFLFFIFTLLFSIGILWTPFQDLKLQKRRLKELESLEQSLKEKEEATKDHRAIQESLTELGQKEFLSPFDEKECLGLVADLAKKYKVNLQQFHFGEPFEDSIQGNQQVPFFVSYTPITITLQTLSEKALRGMIENFNQTAKGIVFPRHLTITYTKNNEFLVTYEFFGVRGSASRKAPPKVGL
ncbi:MAG: hypothetical protein FJX18_06080 [Alphaproteobacteria bacterium]|nr:hypothetical protein [Alphaproteobacteria bacterium]